MSAEYERLLQFIPFIFEWEGIVYECDPDDPDGATKFGIDQRSHPNVKIRDLTAGEATGIYWKEWLDAGCGDIPSPMAECYFDTALDCGLGRAVRWLDAAGGKRANACVLLCLRDDHYYSIARSHKRAAKFLRKWINRTNALRERFEIK
jgi:lysozyme family protein